jgi:hypothetical protein
LKVLKVDAQEYHKIIQFRLVFSSESSIIFLTETKQRQSRLKPNAGAGLNFEKPLNHPASLKKAFISIAESFKSFC